MLRDKFRDEEYFKEYLEYKVERVKNYSANLERIIQERGLDDRGANNGCGILQGYYISLISALYSAGKPIDEIRPYYNDYVNLTYLFKKYRTYNILFSLLTLGTLLNKDESTFKKIAELVEKDYPNDFLVDFMLNHVTDWSRQSDKLYSPVPYKGLVEVIELSKTDKKEAVERLKKYLTKEWYRGHSGEGWYNTHKKDMYSGYWSWESGAIVKLLGLDDTELKDLKYYPYDMVHSE